MYLKSLVLKGFKSFADRSALVLEPGITAIVGPNGSGKSNISDAVLWVLGERNAKNLRGQAMEDVIFAGSSARKSVGIAEVDLVLDNSDGTIPVEYDEVAITRRMYRSGESEYLINGTVARRMDVLDILHDSGLGTGTHSIISQGSLDAILQSKPEDRRALIEEAAGVLKHKQRKAKSERKLAAMDAHLTRVKDVAGEVERQLAPLERKAKRARTYQGLASELADLNLSLAVDDLREMRRSWDAACAREQQLSAQLEERKVAIGAAEKRAEELQEKIRKEGMDAGEIAKRHQRASSAVERFDGTTMLLREKRRAAMSYETELRVGLETNKAKRAQALADRLQSEQQVHEVKGQRAAADEKVRRLMADKNELVMKRKELDREMNALTDARKQHEREREQARREQERTREALANGLAHAKLVEGRSKELEAQLARVQAETAEKTQIMQARAHELEELEAREGAARDRVSAAFTEREATRAAFDAAREAQTDVALQIKALEQIERATSAQAGPALSWLIENKDSFEARMAPLSHAIAADPAYEGLVERLLGMDVSALLVDDLAGANAIAETLIERGMAGEVVLVSRTPRADDAGSAVRAARAEAQCCGARALADVLTYPDEAAPAVEALLGDVVVCDTAAEAFALRSSSTAPVRIASLDGCVIGADGRVVLGGPIVDGDEGVLARARRLDALRVESAAAHKAQEAADAAARAAEEALRQAQGESLKLSQELAALRGQCESAQKDARQAENQAASVRRELEDVERQRLDAEKTVADARPSVENLEKRLAQLATTIEEEAQRLEQVQEEVAPVRSSVARTSEALSEAKLAAATLAERETYAARIVDARMRELEQIDAADADARSTLLKKTVAQKRIEPLLALYDELSASARRWTRDLEEEATAAQDASSSLHSSVNEARAEAKRAHDAFDETNGLLSEARVEKGRLEVQVDSSVNAIVHECGVPLERALERPELEDRAAAEDNAFKLRRRIANMGTINPDAAEEYENLKTRYDYLAAQLADLENARRSLMKIVRVIDARMKDDFIRTYEAVDANFREIFAVLFPGGSAQLVLSDPDDLETTGVEVTAQPRGKRITKMMLMSGGEKSLTALALLFAVYRIRTTPFYILDEVEAALDDSNLRRLTAYLDTLRSNTQLIMITHQRRTMEMADVLFGVSMHADGVTKVVSQKLDHALRYAE